MPNLSLRKLINFAVLFSLILQSCAPVALNITNSLVSAASGDKHLNVEESNNRPLISDVTNFDQLPLSFIPNDGQEDEAVRFQVQGLGGKLFFTPKEVVLSLLNPVKIPAKSKEEKDKIRYDLRPASVVRIDFQGANQEPEVVGIEQLPGVANFLKGSDASQWHTALPTYSEIAYQELYPGIQLHYEGIDGSLKSIFYVAAGADPTTIIWQYKGVDELNIDGSGDLVINLPAPVKGEIGSTLIERAPIAWQEVNGNRVSVAVQYALVKNDKKVSFLLPDGYDPTLPLVIDPVLDYSTYLGGIKADMGESIVLDASGNAYLTGPTTSTDFPTTANPLQGNQPKEDIFVSKLNPAGDTLLYSTYIGGNEDDHPWDIALDNDGRITIAGETESTNFPTTNAYDSSQAGGTCDGALCDDVFVAQLSLDGSALRYSTYLGMGADDEARALTIGSGGLIYVTGFTKSSTFPTTANPYDGTFGGGTCNTEPCKDIFVTKFDPSSSGAASFLYSTFLGGNKHDEGAEIPWLVLHPWSVDQVKQVECDSLNKGSELSESTT